MDHKKIAEEEIIDKYLLGKLSLNKERLFEEHYFSCDQCFEAVKEAEQMILGLRDAAKRGVFVFAETKKEPAFNLLGWIKSFTFSPAVAIATTVFVITLLYPAWQGIFTVSRLKNKLVELRQPQANIPSFSLQQTRAGEEQQIISLPANAQDKTFILYFNILEKTIPAPAYRAEIFNEQEEVIWQEENLQAFGTYEIFSITCNSTFFSVGNYLLKVYEINPENKKVTNEFSFAFKIVLKGEIYGNHKSKI